MRPAKDSSLRILGIYSSALNRRAGVGTGTYDVVAKPSKHAKLSNFISPMPYAIVVLACAKVSSTLQTKRFTHDDNMRSPTFLGAGDTSRGSQRPKA